MFGTYLLKVDKATESETLQILYLVHEIASSIEKIKDFSVHYKKVYASGLKVSAFVKITDGYSLYLMNLHQNCYIKLEPLVRISDTANLDFLPC